MAPLASSRAAQGLWPRSPDLACDTRRTASDQDTSSSLPTHCARQTASHLSHLLPAVSLPERDSLAFACSVQNGPVRCLRCCRNNFQRPNVPRPISLGTTPRTAPAPPPAPPPSAPPPATTASQAAPRSSPSASRPAAPASPLPARWSLTNRIFNLNLRAVQQRLPASRLWNPVNSSPRTLALPNVPVEHPQIGGTAQPRAETRDEYPLLTLPEQRRSRQSPAPSSLVVERSTGGDSGSRTSIGLPRDRRSQAIDSQPQTPRFEIEMPTEPEPAPAPAADGDHPAPIPSPAADDLEAGGARHTKSGASRISLPHSRPASMHSQRLGTASAQGDADGDDESDYPWGPSHPCFPHQNPHVPLNSVLYETTRIIRIKRDWMIRGDLAPTFANLYPEILDPAISEDDFRQIIKKVNDSLIKAFDPTTFRAWFDVIMGVATFWIYDDLGFPAVKSECAALEKWLDDWNKNIGFKEGVKMIPLRRTGYLTLDIQIPDPHVGLETSTISRPNTQQDDLQTAAPTQHGEYGPFPITPTLQFNSPTSIPS
ncbi:Golgin subfamily A member 7/ERF4 family-domain-containing protein [Lophiotrema nucula]|uniref:Ras modification protein ERF4 n=1 Tax=Lophiotrema nucula TaxID=690887 RepID=A0A6A5Z617_9PLEO|nr:Golgin subfamily A member 7/ERF4 family-domain-containing protein [Lophiotrema nucula]